MIFQTFPTQNIVWRLWTKYFAAMQFERICIGLGMLKISNKKPDKIYAGKKPAKSVIW